MLEMTQQSRNLRGEVLNIFSPTKFICLVQPQNLTFSFNAGGRLLMNPDFEL